MAQLDFGLLTQAPTIGSRFIEGQQAAQQQAEQNRLRQMQMMQMEAQRENLLAQREQRMQQATQLQAAKEQAQRRQGFITQATEALAQGGEKFDRPTLLKVLQSGLQTQEPTLIKFAQEGIKALDEEESYQSEKTRLFGGTAPAPGVLPVNALPGGRPTPDMVSNMLMSSNSRIREMGKGLSSLLPKEFSPSADMQGYELAKKEGFKGTFFDYRKELAQAGRPPAQPREPQPQPPVAVVDPSTGKTVYVSREEALAGRMTPAAAIEGLTPKERQAREAKFPQATAAVKGFESSTDTLIKDLQTLADHPGLSGMTGFFAGRLPGITSAGREAEALYDKIVARGGFQELQNMRQASPTGGALGNVSNQEGAQLRQAFAAIDRRQDAPSIRKAIADAIGQLQASKSRVREAYDLTYEYKQQRGNAAPGGGGVDASNPLLK